MIKSLITIVAFVTFFGIFFGAQAQKGIHLGVRFAPQATYLLNQNDRDEGVAFNPQAKLGFMGGVTVGLNLLDYAGLEVGLLYSQQGSESMMQAPNGDYTLREDRNLSYIKVPVLLKLNTSPERRIMGSLFLGPQFSFLTRASTTFTLEKGTLLNGASISDYQSTYYNQYFSSSNDGTKDQYKTATIGVVLGVGVDLKITDNFLFNASVRFDYGLTDVENKDKDYWKSKHYPTAYSIGNETQVKYKDTQGKDPWTGKDPYQYYVKEGGAYVQKGDDRTITRSMTIGLQLGLTYVLPFE